MKLLTEELLKEYGFIENPEKASRHIIKVMSKEGFDIVVKMDGFFYINLGLSYPLRDTASLKKLYKEVKSKDLLPTR